MTTIHLTDAQRDTFTACGLIVIDGEQWEYQDERNQWHNGALVAPEGWRILTEPCDTCDGSGLDIVASEPDGTQYGFGDCLNPDCVGGHRVIALTATCPTCGDSDDPGMVVWPTTGCLTRCDRCDGNPEGVVTLGRFTIPALLPVKGDLANRTRADIPFGYPDEPSGTLTIVQWAVKDDEEFTLDPLPRPGQFIARPERAE